MPPTAAICAYAILLPLFLALGSLEDLSDGICRDCRSKRNEDYRQRVNNGVCRDCPNLAIKGRRRCAKCAERERLRRAETRDIVMEAYGAEEKTESSIDRFLQAASGRIPAWIFHKSFFHLDHIDGDGAADTNATAWDAIWVNPASSIVR